MQSSLRRHLTYWLIGPFACWLQREARFLSHRAQCREPGVRQRVAPIRVLAIASHLRHTGGRLELDLPSIAIEALRIDTEDRVYYQVLGPHAS